MRFWSVMEYLCVLVAACFVGMLIAELGWASVYMGAALLFIAVAGLCASMGKGWK